jgi:hypothetical protein
MAASSSRPEVFATGVQCITSAFGEKPFRMLKLSSVSAVIAVAILRLNMLTEHGNCNVRRKFG